MEHDNVRTIPRLALVDMSFLINKTTASAPRAADSKASKSAVDVSLIPEPLHYTESEALFEVVIDFSGVCTHRPPPSSRRGTLYQDHCLVEHAWLLRAAQLLLISSVCLM